MSCERSLITNGSLLKRCLFLVAVLVHLSHPILAQEYGYQFLVSSEFYFMNRERASGTSQSGRIDGMRLTLQRIQPSSLYLAADYLFATGTLKGSNSRNLPVYSEITDQILELRLGLCLKTNTPRNSFFIPFGGWGKFKEINDHYYPSPIPYTFTDTFNYISAGFLSAISLAPCFDVGINFKTMFMHEGSSEITEDPDFENVTLLMRDVPYFRLELPCTLHLCGRGFISDFRLSPFYEYRHFGGREGYPFDFIDTTFNLFGLTTSLIFTF